MKELKKSIIKKLKNAKEINPNQYDGSYELVQETAKALNKADFDKLNYKDLDMLYLMTVGTWKSSLQNKKKKIKQSSLKEKDKKYLFDVLDKIAGKNRKGEYTKGEIGMFGTGFYSFNRGSDAPTTKDVANIVKMCDKILSTEDEDKCISHVGEYVSDKIYGLGMGSLSQILHCLRPYVFPILNNLGIEFYKSLDLSLKKPSSINNFVENVKKIKEFRDENFSFKNYRVLDYYVHHFEELEEKIKEKNETVNQDLDNKNNKEDKDMIELIGVNFEQKLLFKELYFPKQQKRRIKRQIKAALKNAKHIILTGPPGTGKSKLAKEVCKNYVNEDFSMTTATSDWSTFDTIGGYRPQSDGTLSFSSGIFLNSFKDKQTKEVHNKWLILDEINRADIDKAFGALFSALTGDKITLSFKGENKENIVVKPQPPETDKIKKPKINEYIIPQDWRLIATMNTRDKTSLYEMSYAFMRRFAFIPVGIPENITADLVENYLKSWNYNLSYKKDVAKLWRLINQYRSIGPALVKDIYNYLIESNGDYASAIMMYVLPQFEGMLEDKINKFIRALKEEDYIKQLRGIKSFAKDYFMLGEFKDEN